MKQKMRTIFYSWQSDDKDTKKFIDTCLKRAANSLKNDPRIDYRPKVDDSTKGEMGAVDIPATIAKKIDSCDVFVADLSFVGAYNGRRLVNQNVLYELGYMIGKRTADRAIMLFNSDCGEVKDLPFDISHRRVMVFSIKEDHNGNRLSTNLASILSAYFKNIESQGHLSKDGKIELDNEELAIVRIFATMKDDKRIMVARTMDGSIIQPVDICDEALLKRTLDAQGDNRFIANLDSLTKKSILRLFYGRNGTVNYELAKPGYNIIDEL